jgi:hypothetical protein
MNYLEINQLIKSGKIQQAQQELDSKSFQDKQSKQHNKSLQFLQVKTEKIRRDFVNKSIKKAKKYIKQSQLSSAYELILDLERINPGNSKVQKLKHKVVKQINSKLSNSAKSTYQKAQKQITTLVENNNSQQALQLVYSLQELPETLRKNLETETKRKVIDHKLKTNKKSLNHTPTPQKYDFIKNLFELEPTYKKIQKQLLTTREELRSYSKQQKKILLKEMTREMKILFNKKQYLKAKNKAEKILQIDSDNKQALKFYRKSDYNYYSDNYKKAYKILQSKT